MDAISNMLQPLAPVLSMDFLSVFAWIDQQWDTKTVLGVSSLAFIALYVLCHLAMLALSRSILPTYIENKPYYQSSTKKQAEILIRIVGPIHAVPTGVGGFQALYANLVLDAQDEWIDVDGLPSLIAFSMGYMVADSLVNVIVQNNQMIIHHVMTLLAESAYLFNWYPDANANSFPTSLCIATELSTPFLQVEYLMRKFGLGMHGLDLMRVIYVANGISLLLTWLGCRIATFVIFWYRTYHFWDHLVAGSWAKLAHLFTLLAVLSVLNMIWFQKLLGIFLAKAFGLTLTGKRIKQPSYTADVNGKDEQDKKKAQ